MEHYMKLMRYAPTNWLDVMAMRVDGTTSSWVNVVLQDVAVGYKLVLCTRAQFRDAMV